MSNAELYIQRLAETLNVSIVEARAILVRKTTDACKGRYAQERGR